MSELILIPIKYIKYKEVILYLDIDPALLIEHQKPIMEFLKGAKIDQSSSHNFFNIITEFNRQTNTREIKPLGEPEVFDDDNEHSTYHILWEDAQNITNSTIAILLDRFKLDKIDEGVLMIQDDGQGMALFNYNKDAAENYIVVCQLCDILYDILNTDLKNYRKPLVSYNYLEDHDTVVPVYYRGLYELYRFTLEEDTIIDDIFVSNFISNMNETLEFTFGSFLYDSIDIMTSDYGCRIGKHFQNIAYHKYN